jgi:hypothetical protein
MFDMVEIVINKPGMIKEIRVSLLETALAVLAVKGVIENGSA